MQPKRHRRILLVIISLLFFLFGGVAFYYYNQYNTLKNDPQALSASQTKEIIAQVGQLMSLPADEKPQVATVVNPALVQEHTPFNQTQTGDVILIYRGIKRAILYRPSQHQIIDVAAVIIGTATPTIPATPPTVSPPTQKNPTPTIKPSINVIKP